MSDLDTDGLGTFLTGRVGTGPVTVEDATVRRGGSRHTALFTATWEDGQERFVARIENTDRADSLDTAINSEVKDLRKEFAVMERLADSSVPVPTPRWFADDSAVIGERFFLIEHCPGEAPRTLDAANRQRLHAAWDDPDKALPTQFVEAAAGLHSHDPADLPFFDPVDPDTVVETELERARTAAEGAGVRPTPVINEALRWFERNKPEVPAVTLVHGDFRIGNMLVDENDDLTAVLDWEMARLGDPLFDLGWATTNVFAGKYLHELDRPELACALVEREWLYEQYESLTGRPVDRHRVRYWRALSLFLILIGSLARATWFQRDESNDVRYVLPQYAIPSHLEDLMDLVFETQTS